MPGFESDDLHLHYEIRGDDGAAVVMLHGFGMSARTCWMDMGWFDLLEQGGFRPIALDSRGHGLSEKPLAASDYEAGRMTADVIRLLDHLEIERAHLVGHSMGARTAFDIALRHPDRLRTLTAISVGANLFAHVDAAMFIKALRRDDLETVPAGLAGFADMLLSLGNELEPLIACLSAPRAVPRREQLRAIECPVLLACGEKDLIVGDPREVASALPRASAIVIADCEHTDVLASRELQKAALAFLRAA